MKESRTEAEYVTTYASDAINLTNLTFFSLHLALILSATQIRTNLLHQLTNTQNNAMSANKLI